MKAKGSFFWPEVLWTPVKREVWVSSEWAERVKKWITQWIQDAMSLKNSTFLDKKLTRAKEKVDLAEVALYWAQKELERAKLEVEKIRVSLGLRDFFLLQILEGSDRMFLEVNIRNGWWISWALLRILSNSEDFRNTILGGTSTISENPAKVKKYIEDLKVLMWLKKWDTIEDLLRSLWAKRSQIFQWIDAKYILWAKLMETSAHAGMSSVSDVRDRAAYKSGYK